MLTLFFSSKQRGGFMERGTYSFVYHNEGYKMWALDWDWMRWDRWSVSVREGQQWVPASSPESFGEEEYRALLNHFGLEEWAAEFPKEAVIRMSPRKLAGARREKERMHNLPHKISRSETLGYRILADQFPEKVG